MRNPVKRNRNIGTAKQGYKRQSTFKIPRLETYLEELKSPVILKEDLNDETINFFIEPTINGYAHACTIEDILSVFKNVEAKYLKDIQTIILRQPTRKQDTLSPCWGRLSYFEKINNVYGAVIYIMAQNYDKPIKFSSSITPFWKREKELLVAEGHKFKTVKRGTDLDLKIDNVRNTQLYRTLLHEIGHNVHYNEFINWLEEDDDKLNKNIETYHAIPQEEKEDFANLFAKKISSDLKSKDLIPFDRTFCKEYFTSKKLNMSWFELCCSELSL